MAPATSGVPQRPLGLRRSALVELDGAARPGNDDATVPQLLDCAPDDRQLLMRLLAELRAPEHLLADESGRRALARVGDGTVTPEDSDDSTHRLRDERVVVGKYAVGHDALLQLRLAWMYIQVS